MSEIKQWAVNICITLAATAVFSMLVPNGSMEKVLKFTISLFFVCCLLTPFLVGLPQGIRLGSSDNLSGGLYRSYRENKRTAASSKVK